MIDCSLEEDNSLFGEIKRHLEKKSLAERIREFWEWFASNEKELDQMSSLEDELFIELQDRFNTIFIGLDFEMTPISDGLNEMMISTNLEDDLVPIVQKVVEAAPALEHWIIVAFRQRLPLEQLKDLALVPYLPDGSPDTSKQPITADQLRYKLVVDSNMADIDLFMKDLEQRQDLAELAFVFLQQVVGEYDLIMKVDAVDLRALESPEAEGSKPITELAAELDKVAGKSN